MGVSEFELTEILPDMVSLYVPGRDSVPFN